MIRVLFFNLLFFTTFSASAQSLFNPIPKSVKIDFSDPKGPEYKKRYKEYKDSIRSLVKLEKGTLKTIRNNLNDLPVEDKDRARLKDVEEKYNKYSGLVQEVDSAKRFNQQVNRIQKSESFAIKDFQKNEQKLIQLKQDQQKLDQWMEDNPDKVDIPDSTWTFQQKMDHLVKTNQLDDIPWEETGTDPQFAGEYLQHKDQLAQLDQQDSSQSVHQQYQNVTSLTDEHFGSYDNYMKAKEQLDVIGEQVEKVKELRQQMTSLIKGDLDENSKLAQALKARARKIDAMQKMGEMESSEQAMRRQIEEMRYKADLKQQYDKHLKDKSKGELLNKGLMETKGHFKGHEEELSTAQKAMSDYKKGIFNFKNSDKVKVKQNNSLKGRPLGDRIVIGGYLQINRKEENLGTDFSPLLGYKLNKKFIAGIGGTYRIKLNTNNWSFMNDQKVYGGRVFSEYHVGPFFAHGEYEMMSHVKKDDQTDQLNRIESPGLLFGVGTEYNVSNIVKGNVMILYNFMHNADSPYNKPFVFRFGFNLSK